MCRRKVNYCHENNSSLPTKSTARIRLISFTLQKYERVRGNACQYKEPLTCALFWSSTEKLPHSCMKKDKLKWHKNWLGNFHVLRCYPRHIISWWNICTHKWEKSLCSVLRVLAHSELNLAMKLHSIFAEDVIFTTYCNVFFWSKVCLNSSNG